MSGERLIYLPLGGAGEVGMNCYVYGYGEPGRERLIVVDVGVTFPDLDTTPGVDLILPDISWLEERQDRIEGVFITHAHEDHVGALGHLWPRIKAPVYARRFTAHIARRKMEEQGQDPERVVTVEPYPAAVECGPLTVHSCPCRTPSPKARAWSSTRLRAAWSTPATSSSTRRPCWASRSTPPFGRRCPAAACARWCAIPPTSP